MKYIMLYTSKDVKRILGINADQLSYYVRTKKLLIPEHEGIGRGKSNKFSLVDLYKLALIKKLSKYGIELNFTKKFLNKNFGGTPTGQTIFEAYRDPKYIKGGFIGEIYFDQGEFTFMTCSTREDLANTIRKYPPDAACDFLLIDIGSIIRDIEEKTGEKF